MSAFYNILHSRWLEIFPESHSALRKEFALGLAFCLTFLQTQFADLHEFYMWV